MGGPENGQDATRWENEREVMMNKGIIANVCSRNNQSNEIDNPHELMQPLLHWNPLGLGVEDVFHLD